MKLEIKQRIEQIKDGQVPDGYKRTKIGIIPEEWEEKRIGDVLTQRKTLMCVSKDAPLISFTIEEGVIEPENKKSNKRDFLIKDISTKKFALTEKGDIIYNPANLKFGAIHRNNLRRGVLSPIYGIFYGEQNSKFMGYLLRNQRFIDYAKIYTEGTVEKLKTLKSDTFLRLKIVLPPLAEQEKIVKILSVQDRIIELYQRKIEELQKLKKVYLSKMFPKKGENAPEWRFPQFTTPWEQRKLGDVVQITMGQSPDGSTYSDEPSDYILVQGNADLQNGWVCPRIWTTQITKKADAGDLIMSVRAPAGAMGKTAYNVVIGRGVASIKGNEFIYQLLVKMDMDGFWKTLSCGSTFESLNSDNIKNAEVKVPTTAEQVQIGDFFRHLDNLITLHQRKLEETKKYKKALMQLLLTGIVRCE